MKGPATHGHGFISYRRGDSDALATLLKGRLTAALPRWNWFLDFGSIAAGGDFRSIIGRAISRSDLILVLIDKNWIGERDPRTTANQIFDDNDFVRYEVATALSADIRVLPILVNDGKMPPSTALPKDIAQIRTLNALELRVSRFEDDLANLVRAISGRPPSPSLRRVVFSLIRALIGSMRLPHLLALSGHSSRKDHSSTSILLGRRCRSRSARRLLVGSGSICWALAFRRWSH